MQNTCLRILVCLVAALPMFGADPSQSVRRIFDKQLTAAEGEVMAIVETMPASKFGFAPTEGSFSHARTFGVQARHIAFCLNEVATALLAEPMLPHADQEGPRDLTSKEDVSQVFEGRLRACAQGHRHADE